MLFVGHPLLHQMYQIPESLSVSIWHGRHHLDFTTALLTLPAGVKTDPSPELSPAWPASNQTVASLLLGQNMMEVWILILPFSMDTTAQALGEQSG